MFKFRAKGANNTNIVGLGLTKENIMRLEQGKPISLRGDQLGLPDSHIIIFYGETNKDILNTLRPLLGKDTQVNLYT